MKFGKWDGSIHNDSEQIKRITTAKKTETTPTSIDYENKRAEFKGSGKSPYNTSLDSCTCGDFFRRALPCKHIYRLAFELEGMEVQRGVNKNDSSYTYLVDNLSSLPVQSQEIVYGLCVLKIYHNISIQRYVRNEFTKILYDKGYCIECVPSDDMINSFPIWDMKQVLATTNNSP